MIQNSNTTVLNDEAMRMWDFVRSETYEVLASLTDDQLQFSPEGEAWQSLYYQFGCIARTQFIFAKGLETGKIEPTYFSDMSFPGKYSAQMRHTLEELLHAADVSWKTAFGKHDSVHWPEGAVSRDGHIYRLIAHERLHHGQIISYFTLAGLELPQRFKDNWAL